MTLSRFLKDYIYIPLGGNRKGEFRTYNNLFATFLLGGIWHGAGWTFVFWGALHGVALVIHRAWQKVGFTIPKVLAWFITFNFINITWVFFRAKEWEDAIKVLDGMFFGALVFPAALQSKLSFLSSYGVVFGSWINGIKGEPLTIVWLFSALVLVLSFKNSMQLRDSFKPNILYMVSTIIFFLSIFLLYRKSEFIYFNF